MAVNLNNLIETTPYLLHLTYEPPLVRIRRMNRLESAARLMELGGQLHLLRQRRDKMLSFRIGDDEITLTDQRPLNEKNIKFLDGWVLEDLVEAVNRRVFFWRGNDNGLLKDDQGQFGRYKREGKKLVFLRTPFVDAVEHNADCGPEFCMHNSGGARQHPKTGKSPRGPSTFVSAENASFTIKDVREVAFTDRFVLPNSTEICFGGWSGPWQTFDGQL